jgi:poly(A) polymerase
MESTNETLGSLLARPEGTELAAATRALMQRAPTAIFDIATAIGENRGAWPMESLTRACAEEIGLLEEVAPEAIVAALETTLLTRDVDESLEWLRRVGFIAAFFPELEDCVDLAQEAGRRHKDVWEHTKLVVKQAVRRPIVRWGALLHDIGKVPTRTFTKNGVHFHGHAEVGARMFDKICRRLPFERDKRKAIRFLIKHHLRSAQYEPGWTDSAVRRFAREMDEHLTDLLDLSRADITSKRPGRRRALLHQISELSDRIDKLREQDAVLPPLPKGVGDAMMVHFRIPPSRLIGDLKRELEAAIARGELEERRESEYYIAWIEQAGLAPAPGAERHR